jgi:dTDP-4-dehydrorhamnose reductase
MKILIFGSSGMLGSQLFISLGKMYEVIGTSRDIKIHDSLVRFNNSFHQFLDIKDDNEIKNIIQYIKPTVVINCIGLIKQRDNVNNPLDVLPINSLFPHQLSKICKKYEARLIQISTDCVFSGKKGDYVESDKSDAEDLYGISKYIGEVNHEENCITLRTSIIGHELNSKKALLEWFLSQELSVKGYRKAVFSGLTTNELSRVIRDVVIPNKSLAGLFHISSNAIDKYSLLKMISEVYNKKIEIISDDSLIIDRSLDSSYFKKTTGYIAPDWHDMIKEMYKSQLQFINA